MQCHSCLPKEERNWDRKMADKFVTNLAVTSYVRLMDLIWTIKQGLKVSLAYSLISVNFTAEILQITSFGLENWSSKHDYQFDVYNIVILAEKTNKYLISPRDECKQCTYTTWRPGALGAENPGPQSLSSSLLIFSSSQTSSSKLSCGISLSEYSSELIFSTKFDRTV